MRKFSVFVVGVLGLALSACHRAPSTPSLDFRDLQVQGSVALQKLADFDDGFRAVPRPRLGESESESRYAIPGGGNDLYYMMDVTFDSAGRGYVAGNEWANARNARVRRYDSSRYVIDSSFLVLFTIGGLQNTPTAVRPIPGLDKVYVAGRMVQSVTNDWDGFVARHLSNGALDTSFSTLGYVRFSLTSSADFIRGASVQSDGKLVVSGYSVNSGAARALMARYLTNGNLDTSFASIGYAFYTFAGAQTIMYRVSDDADGSFLSVGVAGAGNSGQVTLWRVATNGSLNTSFSTVGYRQYALGAQSLGYSALWNTDSKIFVSGTYALDSLRRAMVLYRLTSDGALDTSFNTEGKLVQTVYVGSVPWYAPAALTDTGKVVVAWGKTLSRFMSNGDVDMSFSTSGGVGGSYDPQSLAFSTTGAVWGAYASATLFAVGAPIITQAVYDGTGLNTAASQFTIDLGYLPASTGTVSRTIQLTNNGAVANSFGVAGGGLTAPFVFPGGSFPGTGGDCTSTLNASASCNLVIAVTTAANGRYDSQLQLEYQDDGVTRALNYNLTASASDLSVTSFPAYNLGAGTGMCTPLSSTFTVTNNGASTVNLTTERVGTWPDPNLTSWAIQSNTCLTTLASGASCTFGVAGNNNHPDCWQATQPTYDEECRFDIYGDSDEGITLYVRGGLN